MRLKISITAAVSTTCQMRWQDHLRQVANKLQALKSTTTPLVGPMWAPHHIQSLGSAKHPRIHRLRLILRRCFRRTLINTFPPTLHMIRALPSFAPIFTHLRHQSCLQSPNFTTLLPRHKASMPPQKAATRNRPVQKPCLQPTILSTIHKLPTTPFSIALHLTTIYIQPIHQ